MQTQTYSVDARINAFLSRKSAQHPELQLQNKSTIDITRFIEEDARQDAKTHKWNASYMLA